MTNIKKEEIIFMVAFASGMGLTFLFYGISNIFIGYFGIGERW